MPNAASPAKVDFVEVWKVTQQDLKPLISELERYLMAEKQRLALAQQVELSKLSNRRPRKLRHRFG